MLQLKTVEAIRVVQTVDTVWYNFQTSFCSSTNYMTRQGRISYEFRL